ncbi:hypothetical protein K1T71_013751 [Dendrolimus kikuchii]|uniref:Uncharacterized protein n=1 Tax=Dendrolimus kikuchii TaxID=765133 RepID=A0ACC1CHR9_9NEOP|nr:hypothetical protein K1T71_013751 [Dendrolimus kikuchii]
MNSIFVVLTLLLKIAGFQVPISQSNIEKSRNVLLHVEGNSSVYFKYENESRKMAVFDPWRWSSTRPPGFFWLNKLKYLIEHIWKLYGEEGLDYHRKDMLKGKAVVDFINKKRTKATKNGIDMFVTKS